MPWLHDKLVELNTMLVRVAQCLLPVSTTPLGPMVPFHPNGLGADHQTTRVLDAIGLHG